MIGRHEEGPGGVDAIVVLGARLTAEGGCGPALLRRVRRGIELYRAGVAPVLVLCGGGAGVRPEAEAMRHAALAEGVPDAAILVENRSGTTFENAREVGPMLHRAGLDRVVLVTCAYHLPRARFLFRAAGIRVVGTAAARRGATRHLPFQISRELAAWLRHLLGAAWLRWGI